MIIVTLRPLMIIMMPIIADKMLQEGITETRLITL